MEVYLGGGYARGDAVDLGVTVELLVLYVGIAARCTLERHDR